jgi:hypothetical protein
MQSLDQFFRIVHVDTFLLPATSPANRADGPQLRDPVG